MSNQKLLIILLDIEGCISLYYIRLTEEEGERTKLLIHSNSKAFGSFSFVKWKGCSALTTFPKNMIVEG
jgi:hypothetical protein